MVYRQKDGLRFPGLKLCFGVHKSVIFPIQRICRLLSQAVWGVPATPVFRPPPHALQPHAAQHRPAKLIIHLLQNHRKREMPGNISVINRRHMERDTD